MNGIEWNCRTLHDGLEHARLGTRDVDATGVLAMMQLAENSTRSYDSFDIQ